MEETQHEAPTMKLGVIGGTSLLASTYFAALEQRVVATEHGDVVLHFGPSYVFCQRHQADPARPYTPPHLINFRAIIAAFKATGVQVRRRQLNYKYI